MNDMLQQVLYGMAGTVEVWKPMAYLALAGLVVCVFLWVYTQFTEL